MIKYDKGKGKFKNWIVSETEFDINHLAKCESIFCLGNGYMGIRSATEENYVGQHKNTFISGTFNKFSDNEPTELPNVPDLVTIDIFIDNEIFNLTKGKFYNYERKLNIKTAELIRSFKWKNSAGKIFLFSFKRFVSQKNLHLFATKVEIKAVNKNAKIKFRSGINGQVTNSGDQHFIEGVKRIYQDKYIQMLQKTSQSKIDFVFNTTHNFSINNIKKKLKPHFSMARRIVDITYEKSLQKGQTICLEKISNIYTSRDTDSLNKSLLQIKEISLSAIIDNSAKGYDVLFTESKNELLKIWKQIEIKIEGNDYTQTIVNFALYHLLMMTPKHDNRCGIGAKGLSGEIYKGHSFWDTEIFILPVFIYLLPKVAKSLLEFRFNSLPGARKKAKENGYSGAMYPWESAWIDDGEATPIWAGADIVTGQTMKCWTGFIEQHISSDIAFAVWQYFKITGDKDFMERYGYEIIFDTAIFWGSRIEWNEKKCKYHIYDVIGPNEYKEHINNDAFTNYMAHWNIEKAIHYCSKLKSENFDVYCRLNKKLSLKKNIKILKDKVDKIFLPPVNNERIIPENDSFLNLSKIDLSKYKNQKNVGSIFKDFNLDQINEIQVCKQASVVMLLYLLNNKFDKETKISNFKYYEPKTLHDSSLSLAIHSILASDVADKPLAYKLFEKASKIDFGQNMDSSNEGIHAASLGGIVQIIICGFAGVRMVGGNLHINPNLPDKFDSIKFSIYWQSNKLEIIITKLDLSIFNHGKENVTFYRNNQKYLIEAGSKILL